MGHNTDSEYRRYSAVLREDNRNYAITPTRRPRGKAIVDIKGSQGFMKCSVKNLKPSKSEFSFLYYGIWLVSEENHKKVPIKTGILKSNSEGVGESTFRFNADNVKGTGLDFDSFSSLEVCIESTHKTAPGERVLIGELELEEANLSEDPKLEKVSPFGSKMPQSQWWKFYPGLLDSLMEYPSIQKDSKSHRQKGDKSDLSVQGLKERTQETLLHGCSNFGDVQIGSVFQGHQLVGLEYDREGAVKYLAHGIPGRFCLRDQPYGGATGYVYWHPLPGQQYKAGDYGYWLIHIDPVSGEVVFPRKPTKPPSCEECDRTY